MFVRLKAMKKLSSKRYRLTLDVVDPERDRWDYGDCQVRVDVLGRALPSRRAAGPAGGGVRDLPLSPKDPPAGVEAKLLWDLGQAVDGFVDRLFAAGIVCAFRSEAPTDAQERSE